MAGHCPKKCLTVSFDSLQFRQWTHLNVGSFDGVEVFIKSTVTSNHMKDGFLAHLVLNVVIIFLPLLQRILHKIALLCFKFLKSNAANNLFEMIHTIKHQHISARRTTLP